MERLKNVLYSTKNIDMIQSICIKKLKNAVDKETFDFIKVRFEDLFSSVMTTIFEEEIYNYLDYPVKTSVLKINNIVIKESYNYILSISEEENKVMSTYIEDIPEEVDRTEYIDELKRENIEKEDIVENALPTPNFVEELYEIGSKNMYKDEDTYTSDIYIPNIKSLEMIQVRVDKSDYMVTEYCNKFKINDIIFEVSPGNYKESELVSAIQGLIDVKLNSLDVKLLVNFETIKDCYVFSYNSICADDVVHPPLTLDFTIKCSIYCILGFDKIVYNLKYKEQLSGHKHGLCYPNMVLFNIDFTDDVKAQVVAPLNVNYNETKFYDLEYKKLYISKEPLFNISQIKITMENERGEPYNTRDREFYIRFKTISLIN